MKRLTSQRSVNPGYWSPAKKEELVERLAAYENLGFEPEELAALLEDRVTLKTECLHVHGHVGSWYAIGLAEVGNQTYYLMEHEEYGDETAAIIVDSRGKLVVEGVWNGFDDSTIEEIREAVK